MSESPLVEKRDEELLSETNETAFSRFGGNNAPRRSYGSSDLSEDTADIPPLGNVMKSSDLLEMSHPVDLSESSLFDNDEEAPSNRGACAMDSDNDESDKEEDSITNKENDAFMENDAETNDNDEQSEIKEPKSRGRTKKSFRSILETTGTASPPAKEQVDDSSTIHENVDVSDNDQDTTLETLPEESATDTQTMAKDDVQDSTIPKATKEQPDEEALITSIDNLFAHADVETVTVKDIVKSLEAEYDVKIQKPTKSFVRQHLKDLIEGNVESTVETSEQDEEAPPSESEEEGELSDAGEVFDSESSDDEEVKKPKKRKSTKRISPRQHKGGPKQKKPSHVRIHAEMLRKRRIEELRVRNEELQVKQSKEDQKRAEQIAAKFETDTDELRLKRLEDRLDLLQKLDQKRIRVVSDESKERVPTMEKTETPVSKEDPKFEQLPPFAPTDDSSDSEDDFELEIVGKDEPQISKERRVTIPKVATAGRPPVVTKSSAISMLDMVGGLKPTAKKQDRFLSSDKPVGSPGKSMTARAALRNRLRAKQRKGANDWLARELGYKTQEEHIQDCMLAEQKKREEVIKREEERLRANERKQLRERMLLEGNQYEESEEEEEYIPDEGTNAANDGNESDEEIAQAREIEQEQEEEGRPGDNSDVPASSYKQPNDEEPGLQVDSDVDEPTAEQNNDDYTSNEVSQVTEEESLESQDVVSTETIKTCETKVDDSNQETIVKGDVAEPMIKENDVSVEESIVQSNDPELRPDGDNADRSGSPEPPSSPISTDKEEQPAVQMDDDTGDDEKKTEFKGNSPETKSNSQAAPKDKNSGWRAMLQKEAEKLKKLKARKNGKDLVEAEADEEEEEEVAGLEDFGFSFGKKKKDDDEAEDADADKLTEEDLKHVVDDVSDDEGDEEAGEAARKELEQKEEKERHKEIIRRMREGYDGRRGGIAGGGAGARGMHRFDQLVAADNREDAKRLGLLNDDELDSDDEGNGDGKGDDEEEDEAALLDKMLKDRFLHRSSVEELEENFSSDEEEEEAQEGACRQAYEAMVSA